MFNVEVIVNLFNEYREFAFIISLVISIIISLSGVLPSIFVTGANILFWGPILGIAVSVIGEVVGGYVTFKIYRFGVKSLSDKIKGNYKLIDRILVSEGLEGGVFIFQGRIIPFIPSGFVTLAASLSKVNDFTFIIATFLGKIPSICLEGLISYDLINVRENYIRLGMVISALLAGYLYKILSKNRLTN